MSEKIEVIYSELTEREKQIYAEGYKDGFADAEDSEDCYCETRRIITEDRD